MSGIPTFRSAGTSPALSLPLTSFVGREEEIERVAGLLLSPDVRLLTLTGPGGIGKTRLALRVIERMSDRFQDGVAFISLVTIRDPALIPQALAQGMDVPGRQDHPSMTLLTSFLADRQQLLVLDNLEHLPDAGTVVTELLTGCPGVTVLATSRVRLNVSGEHLFPLEALGADAARELFRVRASAVSPGSLMSPELQGVVDDVCERLERLPLAIELAAARITVLSPIALLNRLDRRLEMLTDGPRDVPTRMRTMRNAIAWSYELLDPVLQEVFRRLAVFVGGFTPEAAAVIIETGAEALQDIATLIGASLVISTEGVNHEPRFTMLETIREFALEQLVAGGEESETRRRHAEFFQRMAEEALPHYDGPDLPLYNARVNRELDNCRAAMSWALETGAIETGVRLAGALWRVWFTGHAAGAQPWWDRVKEGRVWCERTLAVADGLPVAAVTEAYLGAAFLARWDGDDLRVRRLGEELLARAREEESPYSLWWSLHLLGTLALDQERGDLALPFFEEARAIAPHVRNPENHLAMSLIELGHIAERADDLDLAAARYEEALTQCRISRNPGILCQVTLRHGMLCRKRGQLWQSARYLVEAAGSYRVLGDVGGKQMALAELAAVAKATMDLDLAARLLGAAESIDGHEGYASNLHMISASIRSEPDEANVEPAWRAGKALPWNETVALMQSLVSSLQREPVTPATGLRVAHRLTPREVEVLGLIAEGRPNRAIAEMLSISERTVENHVLHILTKLQLESRSAAAVYAVRNGLA